MNVRTGDKSLIIAFDTRVFCAEDRNNGIDAYAYSNGIRAYAHSLLREFQKILADDGSTRIKTFVAPGDKSCTAAAESWPGTEVVETSLLRFRRFWQLGGGAFVAACSGADVIFSPSYHTSPWGPIPVVATIHDTTPVTSPSFGALKNRIQRALLWNTAKFSRKCITDSEWSKNDLVRIYDLPPAKVEVVYLGYDRDRFNLAEVSLEEKRAVFEQYGIRSPYILHHGAIQPRKNIERLIQAYRLLLERRRDLDADLVLAGSLSWGYEPVLRVANQASSRGRIILTGPVASEALPILVKSSAMCVIPSLYEGFCLPMVEALACGVPTIASNASCLPEISGGGLRYFDPLSIEDMADSMEKVMNDSTLRALLIRHGLKRVAEFSWHRCARETMAILSATHPERNGTRNGKRPQGFE